MEERKESEIHFPIHWVHQRRKGEERRKIMLFIFFLCSLFFQVTDVLCLTGTCSKGGWKRVTSGKARMCRFKGHYLFYNQSVELKTRVSSSGFSFSTQLTSSHISETCNFSCSFSLPSEFHSVNEVCKLLSIKQYLRAQEEFLVQVGCWESPQRAIQERIINAKLKPNSNVAVICLRSCWDDLPWVNN